METPPAGSVKIPSVLANINIPSMISSSVASSAIPLYCFNLFNTYNPSPGSPIARLLAIVSGLSTGITLSLFLLKASTKGEHP